MALRRILPVVFCVLVSLLVTEAASLWSERASRAEKTTSGLNWARQVASQLEALSLYSREKGEKDPVGWAVSELTQGGEPRVMRLFKIEAGSSLQASETFNY